MNWVDRLRSDKSFQRRMLLALLLFGFVMRLYHLTAPIADRQSWKQTSTATVIRNYLEKGINPFRSEWDVLLGDDVGPRIEQKEAPLYNVTAAALAKAFAPDGYEAIARLLTILGSLLAAGWLFHLTRRLADGAAAWFAAAFFLVAPFSWYYGRVIQSDVWALAAIVLALERFELWLREDKPAVFWQAAAVTALAGLLKPFALHVLLAQLILLAARRGLGGLRARPGERTLVDARLLLFGGIAVLPTVAWVAYAASVGSLGDVVAKDESWTNAKHLWGGLDLLASGAFWARMQARILDQMATPVVALLALAALLRREARAQSGVALAWLAAALAYLVLVRDGNYMHDYYQLMFVPPFAMLAGLGLASLARKLPAEAVTAALVVFAIWSAIYVRTAFYLDLSSRRAGELARAVSAPGDLIVSLDPGATRKNQLIYAAHRRGWHIGAVKEDTVALHQRRGAKWLVLCLEDAQLAAHPEWRERLGGLKRVAAEKGPYGLRREMHLIEVYSLAAD